MEVWLAAGLRPWRPRAACSHLFRPTSSVPPLIPTIVEARDLFLAAVVPPVAALSSLRYADFWALSATGCVPLSALVKYVAVCVRVCWYCHQSGGTYVVDLPDILLPAGQYLDLFDSESETDVPSDSSDEELVEV